ncbi:hypothetical protein GNY06_08670 [Elizabethkingia argentiflava]|uniref:Porin n=1 Tax=Elizabethkingia argenteiflava TaxID=2681556 RepID=A0A845PZD9_9FLAO|nr:hypothetical protein [Elizabethkingia argenteiflava]NAW51450.1 hypothetical protein [Elizabethkingia argenteiflava]
MKIKILILSLVSGLTFAQQKDSIKNYYQELNALKERIAHLEEEKGKQETKKTENIIDRIKPGVVTIFRLGELDWNQNKMNPKIGHIQDEHYRFWSRIMMYLYMDTKINDKFDFRASILSHPYFAFGGNSDTKLSILLDELWLNYKLNENYALRFGRQDASRVWDNQIGEQFDFWKHDGLTLISHHKIKDFDLSGNLAYFVENYKDNASFRNQGKMYGFSLRLNKSTPSYDWKIGTGLIKAEQIPNRYYSNIGQYYYDGDLAPDYAIWTSQLGIKFKKMSNLSFNLDFYRNLKNYPQNPVSNLITDKQGNNSFSKEYRAEEAPDFSKQKTGVYANASIDIPLLKKDLNIGLSYLYMQKYAALDYFAQYDLARWAATNVQGPEIVIAYPINKWMRLRNRIFFTKDIKGYNAVNEDFLRKGNRGRLDLIINF